jgi:hypothetical protein
MHTKAARLIAHEKPLEIKQVELPDEVVVDMLFAGVNPVDRYAVLGRTNPDAPLPRTLAMEAAGQLDGRIVLVHGHGLASKRDDCGPSKPSFLGRRPSMFPTSCVLRRLP